jgi:Peptidase family M28
MGSAVHARSAGRAIDGMICLEMIGCYTRVQPWSSWVFRLLYPSRGDFIAIAGRPRDTRLLRRVKAAMQGAGELPVYSFTGPGIDASDQRNYWAAGAEAVMVTDTAYVRNPRYHTAADTADTLDYARMAAVVDGVLNACYHPPSCPISI